MVFLSAIEKVSNVWYGSVKLIEILMKISKEDEKITSNGYHYQVIAVTNRKILEKYLKRKDCDDLAGYILISPEAVLSSIASDENSMSLRNEYWISLLKNNNGHWLLNCAFN